MFVLLRDVCDVSIDIEIVMNLRLISPAIGIAVCDFCGNPGRLISAEIRGTGIQQSPDRFMRRQEFDELKQRQCGYLPASMKADDFAVERRGDVQRGLIADVLDRNEEHSVLEYEVDDDFRPQSRSRS